MHTKESIIKQRAHHPHAIAKSCGIYSFVSLVRSFIQQHILYQKRIFNQFVQLSHLNRFFARRFGEITFAPPSNRYFSGFSRYFQLPIHLSSFKFIDFDIVNFRFYRKLYSCYRKLSLSLPLSLSIILHYIAFYMAIFLASQQINVINELCCVTGFVVRCFLLQ